MIQGADEYADVLVLRDGEKVLLKGVQKANYTVKSDINKGAVLCMKCSAWTG